MISINKQVSEEIAVISLKSANLEVLVTNYGCHIISVLMPDINGKISDVVLGFDDIEWYMVQDKYIGATVGRVANRIKHGKFKIGDKEYSLAINNGPNHLHGGLVGFDKKIFDYELFENKVTFHYLSYDNEEGYPGNLDVFIDYELIDKTLMVTYRYASDQDTVVNLTNHSYFNLNLGNEDILNHQLRVDSDYINCIDSDGLTLKDELAVIDTPFGFKKLTTINQQITKKHIQLVNGNGFDHPFKLNSSEKQIQLYHEATARLLTIKTSCPYVHVYTANYLDGELRGKNNNYYNFRDGICLETEFIPDSINIEDKPSVLVKKGESYTAFTSYTFEVVK